MNNIKKFIKYILSWLKVSKDIFSNEPPVYTNFDKDGLKIHIGSGKINLQGWINIDARKFSHTHIKTNKLDLEEFKNDSIDCIYLCHVLEHFSFNEVNSLLKLFLTKLRKNGILMISVPDFKSLSEIYYRSNYDLSSIKNALMGGQDYEYNFHKAVFDKESLKSLLGELGFSSIEEWTTDKEFGRSIGDWSDHIQKVKGFKIPISLNLKGIRNK